MGPVLTIGHSTRAVEGFIELLRAHAVATLIDVRTVPRSRHNPQFNREALPDALGNAGIGYVHEPRLGGLRRPRPDSPNRGWRTPSFRGYADHMRTAEFEEALGALMERSAMERVALMCAEAVPWRCHRSLIADALCARGVSVEHITGAGPARPHNVTPWAVVEGTEIVDTDESVGRG